MPVQRRLINFGVGATALCLLVGGAVLADRDAADTQAGKGPAQQAPEPESAEEEATYPESRRSLRDSADAFFAADRVDDTPAEETADAPRRGRRRAESPEEASGAHSNGRSVAEIMAGLAGGDSADTTTTDAGTRRRRRRAD